MDGGFHQDFPRDVCEVKHRVVMRVHAFCHRLRRLLTQTLKIRSFVLRKKGYHVLSLSQGSFLVFFLKTFISKTCTLVVILNEALHIYNLKNTVFIYFVDRYEFK